MTGDRRFGRHAAVAAMLWVCVVGFAASIVCQLALGRELDDTLTLAMLSGVLGGGALRSVDKKRG